MVKKKLYISSALGCIGGYIWLFCNLSGFHDGFTVCLIKRISGIPCPACGSTRALLELIRGNPLASLGINPNGFVLLSVMTVLPVWLLCDVWSKGDSFFRFYIWIEQKLRQKLVFGLFGLLVLLNWFWNIYKGV